MRRVLVYVLGLLAVVAATISLLLLNLPVATRIFFGADPSSLELAFSPSYRVPVADTKTVAVVAAATRLLGSLNDEQRHAATYAFEDNAQRSNWSNFPEGMVPRGGLKLGVLSDSQRANLEDLLAELLSEAGVRNVVHQLAAEDALTWVYDKSLVSDH
ncbi:MAG: DUF3500 domain-containing protein [Gammaproteobacteria bacterium]|nr:DUF3500 domain-containing protein [Gammaproteobacteria bacterium]